MTQQNVATKTPPSRPAAKANNGFAQRLSKYGTPFILPIVLIIVWHYAVILFEIRPYLLPTPMSVLNTLMAGFANGSLFVHGWVTLQEVLLGLLYGTLAGAILALSIARWRFVEKAVYPMIIAIQTIPKVALAPLFVMWLGFGMGSKILTAALLVFFPVLVNSVTGLKSADQEQIDLMRSLKASPSQILFTVKVPTALPYAFAGFKIAVVFSVIGAIVGEFVGAEAGLGYLIKASQTNLDAATTFAVIFCLAILGLTLNSMAKFAEKKLIFWQRNDNEVVTGV